MSNRLRRIVNKDNKQDFLTQPNWLKYKISAAFPPPQADILYKIVDCKIPLEFEKIEVLEAKELYRLTNIVLESFKVNVYELMDLIVMYADAYGIKVSPETKEEFADFPDSWTYSQLRPLKKKKEKNEREMI